MLSWHTFHTPSVFATDYRTTKMARRAQSFRALDDILWCLVDGESVYRKKLMPWSKINNDSTQTNIRFATKEYGMHRESLR